MSQIPIGWLILIEDFFHKPLKIQQVNDGRWYANQAPTYFYQKDIWNRPALWIRLPEAYRWLDTFGEPPHLGIFQDMATFGGAPKR